MSGTSKPGQRVTPAGAPGGMQLFDRDGSRKYLTVAERARFLRAAEQAPREARTLCMTLAWSGCRLSEALALTADRVDLAGGVLVFATLKKRQDGIYRAVPVPPLLARGPGSGAWHPRGPASARPWSGRPAASPKGLRHAFGVAAVSSDIPLNMVQKWLGHAQLSTTAIYADAVGAEEQDIARKMWE